MRLPSDAEVERHPAYRVVLFVLGAALVASMAFLVWIACGSLFDSLRLAIAGPPEFAALRTIEGPLANHAGCLHPRRGRPPHDLTWIGSGAAHVAVDIPCVIPDAEYLRATAPHIAVRLDDRPFAGGRIYEVDIDGRPLLGYAAAAQARRAEAFPELVTNSILPLFFLILLARYAVGVWRARR